jgi:polyketide synthase PksN
MNFDWNKLYTDVKPRRVSLPTYPFARECYWIPDIRKNDIVSEANVLGVSRIHPLLHENTSDFTEQRFSSTFDGQEFFMANHVLRGRRVLPGMAYLEMVRAAMQKAAGDTVQETAGIRLKNIVWGHNIEAGEKPVQVHIGLFCDKEGEADFEIYGKTYLGDTVVYSQGSAAFEDVKDIPKMDIAAVKARCNRDIMSASRFYDIMAEGGYNCTPEYRSLEQLCMGYNEVLAKLCLPSTIMNTSENFVIHPAILDGVLQASSGLLSGNSGFKTVLPASLGEMESYGVCSPTVWAWIKVSYVTSGADKGAVLNVEICDEKGRICVRLKDLTVRASEGTVEMQEPQKDIGNILVEPVWKEKAVSPASGDKLYTGHTVMLCSLDGISSESIEKHMPEVRCVVLGHRTEKTKDNFKDCALGAFEEIKGILNSGIKGKALVQIVIQGS